MRARHSQRAQLLGVVELVNRVDGVFRDADLEFLQYLSTQVAVALENCRLYHETSDLLVYMNSVINSLSGGFISTDLRGNVTRCNNAACRILGVTLQDILQQADFESCLSECILGVRGHFGGDVETPERRVASRN